MHTCLVCHKLLCFVSWIVYAFLFIIHVQGSWVPACLQTTSIYALQLGCTSAANPPKPIHEDSDPLAVFSVER